MASARPMALRILASDSPTYLPMRRPMSRRSRGTPKSLAAALALRDLPQPGMPAMRTPLGISTPKAAAASILRKIFSFLWSHCFRLSSPPISSMPSLRGIISSIPDFCTTCFFCSNMSDKSDRVISPSSDRASARMVLISYSDRPLNIWASSRMNSGSMSTS